MASLNPAMMVLEHCQVAPPPNTAAEFSLPLTYFDMVLVNNEYIHRLFFYDFPHPKPYFVEKIIPDLKTSLSLTLKHFLPVAGNLLYPTKSGKPTLRYAVGDSVSLTFSESKEDFHFLKGNQARETEKFFSLVPQIPPPKELSNCKAIPLLAVQVTFFPNVGIALGTTHHHVMGDASAITHFMRVWALINKLGGNEELLAASKDDLLPFFDRSLIKNFLFVDTLIWNGMKKREIKWSQQLVPSKNKVRSTFVMKGSEIQGLKHQLLSKRPNIVHASSFVVTCAYVWSCFVKARDSVGETANENESEHFAFAAECRRRLDPQIPTNYFGNCIAVGLNVTCAHSKLVGDDGFFVAAELIGGVIHKKIMKNNKVDMKDLLRTGFAKLQDFNPKRVLGVASSPKFDAYDADYGWGKPVKYELINAEDALFSLNKSNKFEGGLEVGLALPKLQMDAFTKFFNNEA